MKRLLSSLGVMLFAFVCFGGVTTFHEMVIARKNAVAGESFFFEEFFEDPGYENAEWSETDTANFIDDAATGQKYSGTYAWYIRIRSRRLA